MHALLLAENFKKGQFVQQGLHYENLSSDLFGFSITSSELEKALYANDGVFIFVENILLVNNLVEACLKIRSTIPIIILSATFHESLQNLFLAKKIRNFFIRPFPFRLLASEMKFYIFNEREKIINCDLNLRDLKLNRETREVKFGSKSVNLRNKEFTLLEFLMMNSGRLLSRETILECVWDRNANILTNTVDVHINKLRKKIDYFFQEEFIHTVNCAGYIFS